MPRKQAANPFYDLLKAPRHRYRTEEILQLFGSVSKSRVASLSQVLADYISTNLPEAISKREALADYRTNPYALLASANVLNLADPSRFADFLFNNKLYAGLETSFGKFIEAAVVGAYPLVSDTKWIEAPEKVAEAQSLVGLSREQKAKKRRQSIWREIDKSCVVGNRRFVVSIKSGPNCINDTQVQAMTDAITLNHKEWLAQTRKTYPSVSSLDVIIGLTYGTERTTNNKENQILIKLLGAGFREEGRGEYPGVLIAKRDKPVRVYRTVGQSFWATIGNPANPQEAKFVFLEVLLSLARALKIGAEQAELEARINLKIQALCAALSGLMFPRRAIPDWVGQTFSDTELFWFATALSAFYDEGI